MTQVQTQPAGCTHFMCKFSWDVAVQTTVGSISVIGSILAAILLVQIKRSYSGIRKAMKTKGLDHPLINDSINDTMELSHLLASIRVLSRESRCLFLKYDPKDQCSPKAIFESVDMGISSVQRCLSCVPKSAFNMVSTQTVLNDGESVTFGRDANDYFKIETIKEYVAFAVNGTGILLITYDTPKQWEAPAFEDLPMQYIGEVSCLTKDD